MWDIIIDAEAAAGLAAELADDGRVRPSSAIGSRSRSRLDPADRARDVEGRSRTRRRHRGWVGTLADVTAEAGAEAAMSDARDKATEASRLKSEFLANMSHEIRTPMNGVIGMTELLLETELDARQREYAQTVRNSGEALLTIINDILDFSKIEAGKLEIEDIDFDSAHGRRRRRRPAGRAGAGARASSWSRSSTRRSPPSSAATRAAPPGADQPGRQRDQVHRGRRGRRPGHARPRHGPAHDTVVRFEVTDTGVGIAPDKLETIFQPFIQADTSTTRRYGGTGLGLAISRQLVALMGGDCGVSSAARAKAAPSGSRSRVHADARPGRATALARHRARRA